MCNNSLCQKLIEWLSRDEHLSCDEDEGDEKFRAEFWTLKLLRSRKSKPDLARIVKALDLRQDPDEDRNKKRGYAKAIAKHLVSMRAR